MKIANFIGTLKKEDGVAQVIVALEKEAQKHNIETLVITGWAEDANIVPSPVIEIPSVVFPLYKEYKLPLPGMRGFEEKLNAFKPDVIHVHSPDTSAWAALHYAEKYKIPIVATHHTDFIRDLAYYHIDFLRPVVWMLLKKLYNRMGAITTPSTVTTGELESHGVKNLETIPWGVDFSRFDPRFRSQEWRKKVLGDKPLDTRVLICVSRMTWEKDLRVLAAAYDLLRAKRSDFAMVVAGDGPARKELQGMMTGAAFLGYIGEKELSEAYASADIFLFPSDRETFGNVTIEAMASGIVPVVANAGGSKTIVKDGENGFLATPKSAEDFAAKVTLLLDDKALYEKIKAAALADAKNYSWSRVFERVLAIYHRLMKV